MRRLLARAHDNGLFLVYSNGIGVDDEICTGVLSLRTCFRFEHAFASNMLSLRKPMILDPYGRILAETRKAGDDLENI